MRSSIEHAQIRLACCTDGISYAICLRLALARAMLFEFATAGTSVNVPFENTISNCEHASAAQK